jgi:diacylglycerol kinase
MSGLATLWGREPAMVVAFVQAIIVLGVAFGLNLSPVQIGAILAAVAIALGLLTRTQVTPTPPLSFGVTK